MQRCSICGILVRHKRSLIASHSSLQRRWLADTPIPHRLALYINHLSLLEFGHVSSRELRADLWTQWCIRGPRAQFGNADQVIGLPGGEAGRG